jgi:truncated hemoglobin YjbI
MESNITPDTQYKQVTVDVPEDRVGEFHAFFGRFLAGPGSRRERRGRHLRHRHHGGHCARGRSSAEQRESAEQRQPTVEPTEL